MIQRTVSSAGAIEKKLFENGEGDDPPGELILYFSERTLNTY